MLSAFRAGFAGALDGLFTRVVASLVGQGLVNVRRVCQDGTRVRAGAGDKSFRRGRTPDELLGRPSAHVESLRALLEDPEKSAALSSRKRGARRRAADERVVRLEAAVAQPPEPRRRQERGRSGWATASRAQAAGQGAPPSTTDADARVMKMPGGGFRPAYNVQLACDPHSRAVVGVAVTNEGSDAGQRRRCASRYGGARGTRWRSTWWTAGTWCWTRWRRAPREGVTPYVPPKPPRNEEKPRQRV